MQVFMLLVMSRVESRINYGNMVVLFVFVLLKPNRFILLSDLIIVLIIML